MTAIQSIQTIFPGSSPNITCVAEFDDMVVVPLDINITFGTGSSLVDSNHSVYIESYAHAIHKNFYYQKYSRK